MSGAIFLALLAICSLATSLVTEAEKTLFEDFPQNLIAMLTGAVVGAAVAALYYFFQTIPYTATTIVYLLLLALGSGFGAMLGYDKIVQTVEQIRDKLQGKGESA